MQNFRSCEATEVLLDPVLTVLVGENASGKSSIVDALRMCTYPASGRQTTWFAPERDLTRERESGTAVEIEARYSELSEEESAVYLAELVDAHGDLIYRVTFATDPSVPRRSAVTWTVGDVRMDEPEPANRRRIAHVYLPALRDAVRDLDGGDANHLHDVIKILLDGDQAREDHFVEKANEAIQTIADHEVATFTETTIQHYFGQTVPPNRVHNVALKRRDVELRRIARLLRLQLAEAGVPVGDIAATGLGYANLLYIALIVLQLVKAHESDLTLLLVEEPEAHLHPQLQMVLLGFLRQQAEASSSRTVEGLHPTGRVQVIVTSHSPNLASAVSVKNLVVVARELNGDAWQTTATALSGLQLTDAQVRKVDRYLTATRAALLFARHVVLVEGIAEMLLLPSLARRHLLPAGSQDGDAADLSAARLRQFQAATLVSVEGVDFDPYLSLLLSGSHRRVDQVVVVTDGDNEAGQARRESFESAYADAVVDGRLKVCVGGTTLEAEMFALADNEAVLKSAFLDLHPRSAKKWTDVAEAAADKTPAERAALFAAAIGKNAAAEALSLDLSKGDFAHLVAEALDGTGAADGTSDGTQPMLEIPAYLTEAIDAVSASGSPA